MMKALKCKQSKNIKYLGHVIDENGLHKSSEKVDAIKHAKRPSNVTELKSFLGLATYYNKFIPKLSEVVYPINKLLKKNKDFVWTEECEKSFRNVQKEIISERTLVHFDVNLHLVLATDASPKGLGAVLSHRMSDNTERPIAFASRTLTKSESRYSQIEKEATAIYWGLRKFFSYCYGRIFVLVTHHKPLVSIFDPHRTLPTMAATRIFNCANFLSGFDYTVEFRRTEDNGNADYLSRFPYEKSSENSIDNSSIHHLQQINTMPVTKSEIESESHKNEFLNKIIQALKNGTSLEKLGLNDWEFSLQDGCVFRGNRIVIPKILQAKVLKELHIGHLGIVKMKALARSYCYWKNIDLSIEETAKSCRQSCMKQKEPPQTLLHPWERPKGPW